MRATILAIVVVLSAWSPASVFAQAAKASAEDLIEEFRNGWNDTTWQQKFRGGSGYMRPLDDDGWQLRMVTLQKLIGLDAEAVPALVRALESDSKPVRILAAQTLGFLSATPPLGPLVKAAASDSDPAVRLYAVDALGMHGFDVDWRSLHSAEKNRDVRKHMGHALDRKQVFSPSSSPIGRWDSNQMASARIGHPAPDFELEAATGEKIRLSRFRGKKAVVLVFIYGDT